MRFFRELSLGFCIFTVLFVAGSNVFADCKEPKGKPIVIGEIGTYSGPGAVFTTTYKIALDLVVSEINCSGGVLGRPIKIIYRDDKMIPDEARKAAQELVLNEKVDFLMGGLAAPSINAISAFAKKNKILYFCTIGQGDDLTWRKGHKYVARLYSNETQIIRPIAMATAKMGVKTWANIGANDEWGRLAWENFKIVLKKANPDVKFEGELWPQITETDFTTYITTLMTYKSAGLWSGLWGGAEIGFVKQAKAYGVFEKFKFASSSLGVPDELAALGKDAPVGVVSTGLPWYAPEVQKKYPEYKAWAEKFMKVAKGMEPNWGAQVGYGSGKLFAEILKKAGSADQAKVIATIEEGLDWTAPWGPNHLRGCDHQNYMNVWVGKTKFDSKGNARIMTDLEEMKTLDIVPTCQEITEMRKKDQSLPGVKGI